MKKLSAGMAITCALFVGLALAATPDQPPVGLKALAGPDHLWAWTGKVHTAMISSTDPEGGNMDMSNFHGKFRGEKVMARIEGPGCIYRIWSAMPSGRIKVYLDGSDKPEISCGFKSYLDGTCIGLPGDFTLGRKANYMPIPFSKSIVITAPRFHFPGYYQVSYQTYDPSVPVESFNKAGVSKDPELVPAQRNWAGKSGPCPCELSAVDVEVDLPGEGHLDLDGPSIIRKISVSNMDDPADPLEGLRLRIQWDGATEPAVDVPLDAFFMNRYNLKDHWPAGSLKNMFVSADKDGYSAGFPMPFARSARVSVMGDGPARKVRVEVELQDVTELPAGLMNFHAEYREKDYERDATEGAVITNHTKIDPAGNYVVLEREGRGHYIGCAIFVKSMGTVWWGEGDEMTYIDGATVPQIQGTGTEDEFNWSWGFNPHMSPVSGTLPVVPECKETIAAQIIPSLRNPECEKLVGHNIAYRLRPSDYVPFSSSIRVSYEVLGQAWLAPNSFAKGNLSQKRGDDYSSVAYWYEAP